MKLNSKQQKTLNRILDQKIVEYSELKSLLSALGCEVHQKTGSSAVSFSKDQHVLRLHRPHPGKELKPYQTHDAMGFLRILGYSK